MTQNLLHTGNGEIANPAHAIYHAAQMACQHFVEREPVAELIILSAVAREHLLLIGAPGTAKSAIVRRVARAFDGVYFEYLLGRFTEPAELFGPIDLKRLREGRYSLPTDGVQSLFFDSDGPYCISDKALGEFVEEPGSPPKVPELPVFYLRYFDQRIAWQLHPRLPRQYSSELYSSEHAGIGFAIQTGPTWIALSARKQACGESLVTVYSLLSRNPILHIDVSHAPEAQNPFVIQGNEQHLFCLTDQQIVHVDLELGRVVRFSL